MKVKVGNQITNLSKDSIASHMANMLTTRAIVLRKEKDFKKSFVKHKELCLIFLRHNKKFVYSFTDQEWVDEFFEFQRKQHELLMQDLLFSFSDGSEWAVSLNDLANLKVLREGDKKLDKATLLTDPLALADWAQRDLSWDQVKDFAILKRISCDDEAYEDEWPSVSKKVIQYKYEIEE